MKTRKRWTDEEDKVLVQLIEEYPQNLSNCFIMASERLERTKEACEFRWYGILSNPTHPKYIGTAFMAISKKRRSTNRKNHMTNISKYTPIKNKVSIWNKLLKLLRLQ